MTSTLIIYKKCLLNKDKNFALDNPDGSIAVESYLSTLDKLTISNFQYIKHSLSLTIRVDMTQANLEMGDDTKDYNYCSIKNGSNESEGIKFVYNDR